MLTTRASAAFCPASKSASRRAFRSSAGIVVTIRRLRAARRLGLVVLVANVADELLEQILERHEAQRVARFVANDGEVQPLAQHAEQ